MSPARSAGFGGQAPLRPTWRGLPPALLWGTLPQFPSPLRGEGQGEGEKRYGIIPPHCATRNIVNYVPGLYPPQSSPSEGRGRLRNGVFSGGIERDFPLCELALFIRSGSDEAIPRGAEYAAIAALPSVAPKKQLVSPPSTGGDKGEGE